MPRTITLKADEDFDELLSRLAERLDTTRSAVIREAVREYQKTLDREALRRRIREASLKTRSQAAGIADELDAASADGL
ncbi:MAG: ribbon-helix-helix protein, CopG family [Gammaproteobacteria bacterium]|jgi:predicted transcriptional regulator|nr:ribbon-helix-helix protein, CopG family [Gammaproteobacteria bacterium]